MVYLQYNICRIAHYNLEIHQIIKLESFWTALWQTLVPIGSLANIGFISWQKRNKTTKGKEQQIQVIVILSFRLLFSSSCQISYRYLSEEHQVVTVPGNATHKDLTELRENKEYHIKVCNIRPGSFHKIFGRGTCFRDDFRSSSDTESDGWTCVSDRVR